jgi:hypothetical protein
MKRSLLFLILSLALSGLADAQYLNQPRESAPSPTVTAGYPCEFTDYGSFTYDLEAIDNNGTLDIAIGKAVRNEYGGWSYFGTQDYNNGSGSYPQTDGNFFFNLSYCRDTSHINGMIFGKLRPNHTRKDLAVFRSTGTALYHNTGNGMTTTAAQFLSGEAREGSWGAFDADDEYEDLLVTDGSEIRIYRSLTTGTVSSTPYTLSIAASKAVLAQINAKARVVADNRWDLVSVDGRWLSIRLNDGSNGFGDPQEVDLGSDIYSVAVADVNNDDYNDVVVTTGSGPAVKVYLNNTQGELESTPAWSLSGYPIPWNPVVLLGDLGSPADSLRNDGWTDLLVIGYEGAVRIFINQQSSGLYQSSPQQAFYSAPPYTPIGKAVLADIQNTGGQSLLYLGDQVYLNKHLGNPTPAPPKNIFWYGQIDQHPTITWSGGTERDVAGYNVWAHNGNYYWAKLNGTLITGESYTDEAVVITAGGQGAQYRYYRVTAVDGASQEGDPSGEVAVPMILQLERVPAPDWRGPKAFAVHPNSPNPFNPSTEIRYELPEQVRVSLTVYDVLGRIVETLVDETKEAGYHTVHWNAAGRSSGVYLARFTATTAAGRVALRQTMKLVLTK